MCVYVCVNIIDINKYELTLFQFEPELKLSKL